MADLSPQPVPSQLRLFAAQIFVGVKKEGPCPPEGLQDLSLGDVVWEKRGRRKGKEGKGLLWEKEGKKMG